MISAMRLAIVLAISSYSTITTGTRSFDEGIRRIYNNCPGEENGTAAGSLLAEAATAARALSRFPIDDARAEHRLLNSVGYITPQLDVSGVAASGVHAIGQNNDKKIFFGIDPDGGAGEAGVAEAPRREELAGAGAAFRRVPSQSTGGLFALTRRPARDSRRFHDPHSIDAFAAVQDHHREERQILGGREKSGVARDSAHRPCVLVVHCTPQQATPRVVDLGWCDALSQRDRRLELGVDHSKGLEDLLVGENVEGLAGDALHYELEENHVPVAVDHAAAGGVLERAGVDLIEVLITTARRGVNVGTSFQPAAVGEQLLHRDLGLLGRIELRQIRNHGAIDVELARLLENHRQRSGRNNLGK